MPLIRGGYALAIVVGWLTYSRAAGLFFTYIIILFSTVYFASLTFYLFEHTANPLVKSYHDAIWWAAMDVTTVGSNIVAVTTVGRVLSVLLAAMGMMMFPIFTVYITNLITRHNKEGESNENVLLIPRKIYHHSRNKEAEDTTDETNDASASASSTGKLLNHKFHVNDIEFPSELLADFLKMRDFQAESFMKTDTAFVFSGYAGNKYAIAL